MVAVAIQGLQGLHRDAKSIGGISKIMKITTLVLISCLALAGSAFADDAAATFKAKCAMCHGATGAADTGMGKSMGIKDLGSAEVQGSRMPT